MARRSRTPGRRCRWTDRSPDAQRRRCGCENGRVPQDPPQDQPKDQEGLFATIYGELRGIARRLLEGERSGHTLQPTALLHEAWLRLQRNVEAPPDRDAFVRAAAGSMRRILVEHARGRGRE